MAELDQKARKAALDAAAPLLKAGAAPFHVIDEALRAYLAALPAEQDGLVERLRDWQKARSSVLAEATPDVRKSEAFKDALNRLASAEDALARLDLSADALSRPKADGGRWHDVAYLMSVIDAAIEDGYDPDEDGPLLDEIRAELKSTPGAPSATPQTEAVAWRCASCGCMTFARIDALGDDGHFRLGDDVRCVSCKNVSYWPVKLAPPPPARYGHGDGADASPCKARHDLYHDRLWEDADREMADWPRFGDNDEGRYGRDRHLPLNRRRLAVGSSARGVRRRTLRRPPDRTGKD